MRLVKILSLVVLILSLATSFLGCIMFFCIASFFYLALIACILGIFSSVHLLFNKQGNILVIIFLPVAFPLVAVLIAYFMMFLIIGLKGLVF